MTNQFSPKVSEILAFSREEAQRLSCSNVEPEHLLLAMMRMKEGPVFDIFQRLSIMKEDIKLSLEKKLQDKEGLLRPINIQDLLLNESANNILKLAVLEARMQHEQCVNEQHLLLAILHDRADNGAKQILEDKNIHYTDVLNLLKAPQTKDALQLPDEDEEEMDDQTPQATQTTTDTPKGKSKTPVLDNFSTDLTRAALEGKLG